MFACVCIYMWLLIRPRRGVSRSHIAQMPECNQWRLWQACRCTASACGKQKFSCSMCKYAYVTFVTYVRCVCVICGWLAQMSLVAFDGSTCNKFVDTSCLPVFPKLPTTERKYRRVSNHQVTSCSTSWRSDKMNCSLRVFNNNNFFNNTLAFCCYYWLLLTAFHRLTRQLPAGSERDRDRDL